MLCLPVNVDFTALLLVRNEVLLHFSFLVSSLHFRPCAAQDPSPSLDGKYEGRNLIRSIFAYSEFLDKLPQERSAISVSRGLCGQMSSSAVDPVCRGMRPLTSRIAYSPPLRERPLLGPTRRCRCAGRWPCWTGWHAWCKPYPQWCFATAEGTEGGAWR